LIWRVATQVLLLPGEDINKELCISGKRNVLRKVITCHWGPIHYPLLFEIDNTSRNIYQDKKSAWSCGPVTIVLFIQQLLSLLRERRIQFNGVRHKQQMGTEKWDTFGSSCYMNEDTSKGVWWNWNEKQNYTSIEDAIMMYLKYRILTSFMDKSCCKEMVMCDKPANYVSPWKEPFGRYTGKGNTTESMITKLIVICNMAGLKNK
jgi:hypothetical protein